MPSLSTVSTLPSLLPALSGGGKVQRRLLPAPREAHFSGESAFPGRIILSVPGHGVEDEFAALDLCKKP